MFAKKAMVGNTKLIHSDASVSTSQLGLAILCAAFLGSEQRGAVTLEVRPKKAMLGLRKVNGLFADPKPGVAQWPSSSIEA
jgi:hypothetical protein